MSVTYGNDIVLFKAVSEKENDDDDAYYKAFSSAGFQVTVIPVLDFEFVNLNVLATKLKSPNDYAGIIFSSPRVVTGVGMVMAEMPSVLENWKNHKHFVVGEKTGHLVENLGFTPIGEETGNAKNLAKLISSGQYGKPFLYPKGSLTKDSFKLELKENHIDVDDLIIYKTKPHTDLEKNLMNLKPLLCGKTIYFAYFSPSGVNFSLPIFRTHQFNLDHIKFIAIGPTTERGLQENGLVVAASSPKPDPQSLLDTVLNLKQNVNDS